MDKAIEQFVQYEYSIAFLNVLTVPRSEINPLLFLHALISIIYVIF